MNAERDFMWQRRTVAALREFDRQREREATDLPDVPDEPPDGSCSAARLVGQSHMPCVLRADHPGDHEDAEGGQWENVEPEEWDGIPF